MANDALAQSGIDLGLLGEDDYDVVYAAVTATERGRRFLTELADRNRRTETDALMAAIARIEAALRSDEPPKQSMRPPELGAAADRLADIAFELRERGADAALCDALDAAVRDISAAGAGAGKNQDSKQITQPADGDRRTAADRSGPEPFRRAPDDPIAADVPPPGEAFDLPLQDSGKFAEAAAALAASLTALDEEVQAESEPPSVSSAAPTVIPPHDYETVPAPQPATATAGQGPRWHIEAPDFVFHRPARAADNQTVSGQAGRPQSLLPGPQLLTSPDEDPAELFEPSAKRVAVMPASAPAMPAAKPTPLASAVSAAAQAIRTTNQTSRGPAGPAVRPIPRPAPASPLAALRGLTEEELIALFG